MTENNNPEFMEENTNQPEDELDGIEGLSSQWTDELTPEEKELLNFDDDADFADYDFDPGLESVNQTLDRFVAIASVDAVFGDPYEHEDTLIIPAAEVVSVLGFGVGTGGAQNEEGNDAGGSGGGGGGWSSSRPVAVIVASKDGVRIEPVVDVTKVAIAALTTAGFMLGLMLRMAGRRR